MPELSLNLRIRGIQPSATVAINDRANALLAEGKTIFKLGLGQSPFPVPVPIVNALKKNAHQKDYLPAKGLPALRKLIAERYSRKFNAPYEPDDVIVGPGSKELMFLLQIVFYGDLVIPSPAWVSYAPQARIIGRHVQSINTTRKRDWKITPAQLESLCALDPGRPRVMILNYPANPSGLTFTKAELQKLAKIARKYGVILLSDEIYGRIHHEGRHTSIVPMYPEGTIYSGGLSKWCGAGGWRLGFFLLPPQLRPLTDALAAVASETFTSTSAPIQYAAMAAFTDNPEIDRYVVASRKVLKILGSVISEKLHRAGVEVAKPEGGFYLFPDFTPFKKQLAEKGIRTSRQFCEALLHDTGVAILPGSEFGRPEKELTARIAYVNFDGRKALNAALAVKDGTPLKKPFAARHCPETIEAIERIARWLPKD